MRVRQVFTALAVAIGVFGAIAYLLGFGRWWFIAAIPYVVMHTWGSSR